MGPKRKGALTDVGRGEQWVIDGSAEISRELEMAHRIQLSLLPEAPPDMRGIRIACRSIPAHHVGGDYYDFFRWDDTTLDFAIADVSGHNLGAALIMVETRSVLRAHAYRAGNAGDALALLNELLYDDLTRAELFLSMFYAKYDADTHQLVYANGGQNPPLLLRCGQSGCMELDTDGMVLGVMKGTVFEEKSILLREGDLLLLYTDGITESQNSAGELYGKDRLCRAVYAFRGAPPEDIIDALLAEVKTFTGSPEFQDDISLVVMKVD
jgi:sigma-B regulation protein RsbU (phosphoserine phosphatase)